MSLWTAPVILFHQGALGDVLLSLPALYALRRHHGERPWTMVGNPGPLSLLYRRYYAQEVRSAHQKEWSGLYLDPPRLSEAVLGGLRQCAAAYVFAPRRPDLFMRNLEQIGVMDVNWLPSFPDQAAGRSIPEVQREALSRSHIPWAPAPVLLFPHEADRRQGTWALEKIGLSLSPETFPLAMHPGSGGRGKCWPLDRFLALAERLRDERACRPFFILGPAEEEYLPEAAGLIAGRGFPLFRNPPLPLLAGALTRAAAYVGNDSGVTHLASALNLPVLALYGPTDPRLWGPAGGKSVVLQAAASEPFPAAGAVDRRSDGDVWEHLTVDRVFKKFLSGPSVFIGA